jgi:hypothetical protein
MVPAARWTPLATLRRPSRLITVARVLMVVWAIVAWNVTFDRVLVVAGRQYVYRAALAAAADAPRPAIQEWMRPASRRAFRWATLVAVAILAAGLGAIEVAARRSCAEELSCPP